MARLIDTSVFVDMERQNRPLSEIDMVLAAESIGVASITASELLLGVHRAASAGQRRRRLIYVEAVLDSFPVIAFDLDMARTHARLSADLTASGKSIGVHDLLIAATALTIGYGLMTLNRRHFDLVPRLDVSEPGW